MSGWSAFRIRHRHRPNSAIFGFFAYASTAYALATGTVDLIEVDLHARSLSHTSTAYRGPGRMVTLLLEHHRSFWPAHTLRVWKVWASSISKRMR